MVISEVMRGNLRALNALHEAAGRGDLDAVTRIAAEAAETPGPARRSPTLKAVLPDAWRLQGRQVHDGLREIAKAPGDPAQVHARLADVTAGCVACHASYRLVVE